MKKDRSKKEAEAVARLRELNKHESQVFDYIAGGKFCLPLSQKEHAELHKLRKRFLYDPEFSDTMWSKAPIR